MNISELALVQERVNALIGQAVTGFGREEAMLHIFFGDVTLRVQCFYRLNEQGRTLLGNADANEPSEAMWQLWESLGLGCDAVPEEFQANQPGANRLDERIEQLNGDLSGLTVRSVMLDQLGDLTLLFACDATLTVMSDTSGGEECWRLYAPDAEDLVVYGDGVELAGPGENGTIG